MPDEPQGESVAYSADGTALLTVSEGSDPVILRYLLPGRPAVASPLATRASRGPSSSARPSAPQSTPVAAAGHDRDLLSFGAIVTGVILLAGALVLISIVALRRRR